MDAILLEFFFGFINVQSKEQRNISYYSKITFAAENLFFVLSNTSILRCSISDGVPNTFVL